MPICFMEKKQVKRGLTVEKKAIFKSILRKFGLFSYVALKRLRKSIKQRGECEVYLIVKWQSCCGFPWRLKKSQ